MNNKVFVKQADINTNRALSTGAGALATFMLARFMMDIKHVPTLVGLTAGGGVGGLALHEALAGGNSEKDPKEAERKRQQQIDEKDRSLSNVGVFRESLGGKALNVAEGAGGFFAGNALANYIGDVVKAAPTAKASSATLAGRILKNIGFSNSSGKLTAYNALHTASKSPVWSKVGRGTLGAIGILSALVADRAARISDTQYRTGEEIR